MDKERILKNIKGLTSAAEREELLNWVNESEENATLFYSLKSGFVFDNLPYKVIDRQSKTGVMSRLRGESHFRRNLLRAAAILLIPLVICTVYELVFKKEEKSLTATAVPEKVIPEQKQITTLYKVNQGVKGLVNLPDGSRVWLNSNSTLDVPDKFDSVARIVELNGEGYFYVESNREWPMYVRTNKGITVKVTGTEFNLTSYDNDSELKFTLLSGEATLIRESTNQEISVRVMEEIVIPDNSKAGGKRGVARVRLNTGWKDGLLVFEDTPMTEVIKKMERWYGVSFTIRDKDILSYCFTATFSGESITQVLELLKITSNIGYSIKNKNVILYFK